MFDRIWVRCCIAFVIACALTAIASITFGPAFSMPVTWNDPVSPDLLQRAVRVDPPQTTTTTTIPLPTWNGSRPAYYGGNTGCSQQNADLIARAMWNVGADNWEVEQMLYIASRESACDSAAYNGNRNTGDDSWGFCQLNVLAGFFKPGQILAAYNPYIFANNPQHNAEACARLYQQCGFGPWTKGDYGCRKPR